MNKMMSLFEAARRVSVPIVVVRTADQIMTVEQLSTLAAESPLVQWDAAAGMTGLNDPGRAAMKKFSIAPDATQGFVDGMLAAARLPQASIVFVMNAHRQLQSSEPMGIAAAVQSVANLRGLFKKNFRMLVLLGPSFTAPSELDQDIVVLEDELPGRDQRRTIIKELYKDVGQAVPKDDTLDKAVDATCGLSGFATEQVTAMSFEMEGDDKVLNVSALWERTRVAIEQVDGLSVYRGGETFDDLRGLSHVKTRLKQYTKAKTPVGVVVWIDEGSDVFANVEGGGDTSNTKTDQQRTLLVEMENNGWKGIIGVGVPGSGKSAIARAFGNEAGVPTIAVDFGAMENKYVGESEARLRAAIRTIKGVGDGNAFFVLTCNSLKGIRPQFMRRFKKGVFFFDLPTAEERNAIWALYIKKFNLDAKQKRPDDTGWTGAEIRECCENAWDVSVSLVESAAHIIPVSRSRAMEIEQMRKEANGKFLDASKVGTYHYDAEPMKANVRAIALTPSAIGAIAGMKES